MTKYRATLAIGAIMLLGLAACQADDEVVKDATQVEQGSGAAISDTTMLDNQNIALPDNTSRVQLQHGTGEFEIAPGASKGRVTLIEGSQYVWQSAGRTDLITAMAIDNGGSGSFSYIAVYAQKDGSLALNDSAFLGDRVKITSVGIGELVHDKNADYRITIQMLERADGAPMASEANVPSTRIFYVTNGKLEPASPIRDDT